MKIYNGDIEVLDVICDDASYVSNAIMGEHQAVIKFSLSEYIALPMLSFVTINEVRYVLYEPPVVKKVNSRNYEYTVTMRAESEAAKRWKLRNLVDGRLEFSMTAKPHEFVELIIGNLNLRDEGWTTGECIDAIEATISFSHNNCIEALQQIANTFNTEYEIAGKTIHLRKVEYFKDNPLHLSYGKGNGLLPDITRSNYDESQIGVLYVQGGDRNIDRSRYKSPTLHLPKSGRIGYDGTHFEGEEGYIESNARIYQADASGMFITNEAGAQTNAEDSLDCSSIYPKRVGEVSALVVVDAKRNLFDIIDDTIPETLDYEKCLIAGQSLTVIFQSGMLSGKEFEAKYIHADRRFEIVPQEIDGIVMPGDNYIPLSGDRYAVFGCMLPDAYINDEATKIGAEWDIMREAVKVLYEREDARFTIKANLDGIWSKRNWDTVGEKIRIGGYISFIDDSMASDGFLIRITSIKTYINKPKSPTIELSNKVVQSSFSSSMQAIKVTDLNISESQKNANRYTQIYSKYTVNNLFELVTLSEEEKDAEGNITKEATYAIRAKYGLYSDSFVSAKGLNPSSSGGGGGGASALYQLLDVLPNAGNDGVLNAFKGSVLTYNGTKWQAGIIHIPTNLSEFNNDSGFITSAAIPTKLSAFTNDSGFITSAAIPASLKNPYALKFGSQSYDGSSAKTITASDLGALTSHQSIYQLTIKANDATVFTFTPNSAAGSIAFVAGSNISLSADATNKKITIANTYSYTHPTNGANTTIAAAVGKVLGAITVNSLGHVTSVSAKTLVAADVTDLADVLDDYATITYVNDELAGTNETVSTLVEKVNNFLEGTDTDGIINKWKELEAFLAGQTQTSTLADLLNVKAFASTKIIAGTGLTGGGDLTADRTLSLAASGVTAGTYTKVTVDQYGRVTAGSSLLVDDIPNLPWSKITSGKPTTLTGYGITDGVNSVKVDGSGNAVTAASVSGHVLTLTKGNSFLLQSSFDDLFEKVLLEDGKTYAIRAKYGFYSDSFVSAKGLNPSSSGGGGGGASALYQLLDVVPNSTGTGVLNAVSGAVLMYNGSKWQAGTISVPNALSQLTNDAGFITSAALPTKVSQLNNDVGYITGVNSSMIISALGYTPYNSSNPNGYISGISKSMVEGVLTGNITSHTHSQYLTEHQSIYSLTLNAGAFTKDIYTPNSEAKTINIPTTTSHIREGNNLYFTNQRAVDALSATLLGYQPLISDLEIIRNSASEGHTAYGWGNHANAGYLTGINSTMVVNALGYTPYNSTNPNGYISGITKAMVENVLTGNITSHSHTFASITSKPTTIAGYGITDALTTSNYNSYCPSLTGSGASGTWGINISGNAATANIANLLSYKRGGGFDVDNPNALVMSDYGSGAPILNLPSWYEYGGIFTINTLNNYNYPLTCQLGWDVQHGTSNAGLLYFRSKDEITGWRPWTKICTEQSGNAISATKLQTPRTIWGQSFDGTGNVSGSLSNTGTITASAAATYDIGSNSLDYRYGYFQWIGAKSNTNLRLAANNSDNQIVLHTNGNVGIGKNFPEYKLDVDGIIKSNNVIFGNMYSNNNNAAAFMWDKPSSYLTGVGSDGTTDTIRFSACNRDGTWVDYTQNWKFYGNIAATGAITAKASSSDIRLKKDISSYSAIDIIRGHRSVKYHWNDVAKANSDVFKDDDWHYGLIAQEMQEDMPQMVSDVFKDYLVINYERLIPICWKGLQEVDDEVTRLKKKVRKLEMEIRELKQGA